MPRPLLRFGLLTAWVCMTAAGLRAAGPDSLPSKPLVYTFELAADIMPPAWRTVKRAVEEAHRLDADIILVRLDTYGGMVNIADSISQKLLHARALTMVHIVNNAASAGALISISCDSIYMAPSSQIGAVTVVSGPDGQAMPDKYQAYMRAKMRSVAEAKGRDPAIAEAMVDQDLEVEGVVEAGKTLVFTSSEAMRHGFCEAIVDDWKAALEHAGIDSYDVVQFEPTGVDQAIKFLVNPVVAGILLMVMFFGIYAELQSPGVGFPLGAAVLAATLYFAPHYLDGLAANWEIALFIVGVILLGVEIFVLPGFGVAGVSGMLCMVVAMALAMVGNDRFDFTFTRADDVAMAFVTVLLALVGSAVLIFGFLGGMGGSPFFRRLVLEEAQQSARGYHVDSYEERDSLAGAQGVAVSDLRPAGKVDVGPERYDAATEGGYIDRGSPVRVVAVRGNYLLVRAVEEEGEAESEST